MKLTEFISGQLKIAYDGYRRSQHDMVDARPIPKWLVKETSLRIIKSAEDSGAALSGQLSFNDYDGYIRIRDTDEGKR